MLVSEFKKSASEHVEQLDEAIRNNDMQKISQRAHKLKGAAVNLGFEKIASIAGKMEDSATQKHSINYSEKLNLLRQEFKALEAG